MPQEGFQVENRDKYTQNLRSLIRGIRAEAELLYSTAVTFSREPDLEEAVTVNSSRRLKAYVQALENMLPDELLDGKE